MTLSVRFQRIVLFVLLFWSQIALASDRRDIVLMIDNSGSMRKNDPGFLTKIAATEFVEGLSEQTRVAVVIFDQKVTLALPLTFVNAEARNSILQSLEGIDYRGQRTDIPAAMERSIYELKTQGDPDADQSILFITDGIVDTGDPGRDLEKTRWLRENLAEEAVGQRIRIFGIAFTDAADFELIQSLSQKTKGEYFRAFSPEDIPSVFEQFNLRLDALVEEAQPTIADESQIQLEAETRARVEAEARAQAEVEARERAEAEAARARAEAQAQARAEAEAARVRAEAQAQAQSTDSKIAWLLIALAILLGFSILALLFLFWPRKQRPAPVAAEVGAAGPVYSFQGEMPTAWLKDVSGVTGQERHDLAGRITRVGRLAGSEGDSINHIVIRKGTISRQHAVIEYKNHSYWLIDQGSSNGSMLNHERTTSEARLKHGDVLSFDAYDFEFGIEEMSQEDDGQDRTIFRGEAEDVTILQTPAGIAAAAALGGQVFEDDSGSPAQVPETSAPEAPFPQTSPEDSGEAANVSPEAEAKPVSSPAQPPEPPEDPQKQVEDKTRDYDRPAPVSPTADTGEYEAPPPVSPLSETMEYGAPPDVSPFSETREYEVPPELEGHDDQTLGTPPDTLADDMDDEFSNFPEISEHTLDEIRNPAKRRDLDED